MARHEVLVSLSHKTLDNTVGAVFLGIVGASILFGVTSIQTYWYYHAYPRDTILHKVSVALLWTLDCIHQALIIHAVYIYLVKGFGNLEGLTHIVWSIKLQVSINVVIILMVQCLYTFRVWLLGGYHRGFLGYLVAAVVAGGFVIGTVFAYEIYTVDSFSELDGVSWAIDASLATSTTIDFIIAAAMCYYLRKSKGQEMRLNSRISSVMQYTLSSGLLTSACSLSAMFTYILLPNTFIFVGVEFLLTKLYVGSFLAMLNARERTRDIHQEEEQRSRATSTSGLPPTATMATRSLKVQTNNMVRPPPSDESFSSPGGFSTGSVGSVRPLMSPVTTVTAIDCAYIVPDDSDASARSIKHESKAETTMIYPWTLYAPAHRPSRSQ